MTVYVTEHAGVANLYRQPVTHAPLAAYSLSSVTSTGGASTAPFPQAGTQFVRVTADAGSLLCLISTSTATAPTSTNSYRISGNAGPELFAVSTLNRIIAAST
jgi:hypothetical protein